MGHVLIHVFLNEKVIKLLPDEEQHFSLFCTKQLRRYRYYLGHVFLLRESAKLNSVIEIRKNNPPMINVSAFLEP